MMEPERYSSTFNSHPTPLDVQSFIPYACQQLQANFTVKVKRDIKEEYVSKIEGDKGKKRKSKQIPVQQSRVDEEESFLSAQDIDEQEADVVITALYDTFERLTEFVFHRCIKIPQLLLKVVALCIPFHENFNKLTLRWSQLTGIAVYEIAKFLPISNITEICLDDSPVAECNYHTLLEHTQVQYLSLCRCNLDDKDCAVLASKLVHPLPAAMSLSVLSLASNLISDEGARAIGEALRSNRTLQHLNLAGNRISDEGAEHIFRSVAEFPLSYDELTKARKRHLNYLKEKKEVYDKCYKELLISMVEKPQEGSVRSRRKTIARSRKVNASTTAVSLSVGTGMSDVLAFRAELLTMDLIGLFTDPFIADATILHDDYLYSMGNQTLCYLNLAYNNLGYCSVVKLMEVLMYQNLLVRKCGAGLLRVVIEGNDLPLTCDEMLTIEDLLVRTINGRNAKTTRRPTTKK